MYASVHDRQFWGRPGKKENMLLKSGVVTGSEEFYLQMDQSILHEVVRLLSCCFVGYHSKLGNLWPVINNHFISCK
jgi:hypothetical protein